jgi:hypothetical protein
LVSVTTSELLSSFAVSVALGGTRLAMSLATLAAVM